MQKASPSRLSQHTQNKQSKHVGYLLLPVRCQLASLLVVATQSVDTRLDQDEPELGILILPVTLQMLADGNGLLDKAVQVLGNGGSKTWTRMEACELSRLAIRKIIQVSEQFRSHA
jgi:hypothetical protein